MSDDAEDAALWTDAADEAEAADESDTAHEADTADEAEAEAFWCDVAAAPPSPQRLSDWPIIFLAEARRLEQEASEAKAALATGSFLDQGSHQKQTLLTSFFQGSSEKQPDKQNPLARFRSSTGPAHPAYETLEQRQQRLKREAITKQCGFLSEMAKQKEIASAGIRDLIARRRQLVEEADKALLSRSPKYMMHESARSDSSTIVPEMHTREQPCANEGEGRPLRIVRSECTQILQQPAMRRRGRPCLTPEEKARRKESAPKRKRDGQLLHPNERRRCQTPGAELRRDILHRLDEFQKTRHKHGDAFWQDAEDTHCLPRAMLKRFLKPCEREKLKIWMQFKPQRCRRFWKRFQSTDTGCRLGANGAKKKTKISLFKEEMDQVSQWATRQESMGHDLSEDDLLQQFILILESTEFELQETKINQGGHLAPEQSKKLEVCNQRLENFKKQHNLRYATKRLCFECGFTQHRPSNVVPMTAEENDLICTLSWQSWDYLVDKIARGSQEDLRAFVASPEGLIKNRAQVALCFQDAVPAYLDMSTGKILVRYASVDEQTKRRARNRLASKGQTTELQRWSQ